MDEMLTADEKEARAREARIGRLSGVLASPEWAEYRAFLTDLSQEHLARSLYNPSADEREESRIALRTILDLVTKFSLVEVAERIVHLESMEKRSREEAMAQHDDGRRYSH